MYKAVVAIVAISSAFLEASAATEAPQLFYFKDGKVGFNFLGFHGAAGLNGLSSGGSGLHAEIGTPFGQGAAAGFGGALGSDGNLGGNLYAGATAGGNVKAAAGLGGVLTSGAEPRAVGGLYSAASAGPARAGSTLAGGISERGSFNVAEKVGSKDEPKQVVEAEKPPPRPSDNRTKKTYTVRGRPVKFDKFFRLQTQSKSLQDAEEQADLNASPTAEKTKYVQVATNDKETVPPVAGDFLTRFFASPPAESPNATVGNGRSTFFNDIFNIPISTLSAVNHFLNNIPRTIPAKVVVEKTATVF